MLVYLEALCAALLGRDAEAIARLLRHPMSRALPKRVREEALLVLRAPADRVIAPVATLHFQHQTAHLLGVGAGRQSSRLGQFELPLRRAAGGGR